MQIKEVWKDIPGYSGMYMVSNMGRVKSLPRWAKLKNSRRMLSERILKESSSGRYKYVVLCRNCECRTRSVHRLVAGVFLSEFSNDLVCDHISGDSHDNRLENLRMVSFKDNQLGARKPKKGYSSDFRGVSLFSGGPKWRSICNGRHIGLFSSEEEAARAWDAEAIRSGYLPEALNFI